MSKSKDGTSPVKNVGQKMYQLIISKQRRIHEEGSGNERSVFRGGMKSLIRLGAEQ